MERKELEIGYKNIHQVRKEKLKKFFSNWLEDVKFYNKIQEMELEKEEKGGLTLFSNHKRNKMVLDEVNNYYSGMISMEITFFSKDTKNEINKFCKDKKILDVINFFEEKIFPNYNELILSSFEECVKYINFDYATNKTIKNKIIVGETAHQKFEHLFKLYGSETTSTFEKKKNGNVHISLSEKDKKIVCQIIEKLNRLK